MDSKTYTYSALAKKHDNFTAPGFEISVGGKKLSEGKFTIPRLEVEMSATGTAGGCSFTVEGQYDFKNRKWTNDAADLIKPGAKLVVEGGYVKHQEMFYGYVDDITLAFRPDGAPIISVNGLDGLGYLMNMCEPFHAGEKKPKQIVQSVLQKSQSAGFAKKIKVGSLSGFETPIVKEGIDDWKFLCMMAERYGASILAIDGEMIFDTLMTKTAPILTLTMGQNIRKFTRRVSFAHQVGKVEILGRDINEQPIKGEAMSVTVGGKGKIAADWISGLKKSVKVERDEFVRTEQECKKLAQNRFNSMCMGFVSGEGECIGIPELIPGRYLKVDGGDDMTNGTYFLTKVVHHFRMDKFTTSFEYKGAKA